MADNTISPVVPNVSGGRTVSTGQKAVTQTSAQSGIDFKSYLGGRTAVQDNSTTFLKRRNSYTLNKNKTKEISIKTASKNSPTESEVKKITDDISSQIVEKVTDDLDISEDELNNAMQLLGLTAMDLLNPANLSALYCEVTGNASDPQALVLNADFTALFNDVSQVASENDAQLDLLSQLTASDDGEILDADIVSSADTTEKTVDSSYDDTAASGQNINDTADEAVKVYDGGTQDSSYQNSDEGTSSGETGNGIISDENTEKTQSKSQVDSSFDDSGERVLHHDDDAHSDNSVLHASVSEQLNTDTSFEMSQSQSRLRVDTTDIIRQIVDSMSISNTTEESAINLQLTPESLGRMYINVSQKNSEISARIAVSNEAVKEALQTQMVNLKEALNNSGIRVNEVEITVASHEFERNLEQGAANDSRQQESTNSYNGSNSSDSGIDSDMMQDRVEERLVTQIIHFIVSAINELNSMYDFIIIDTGAGVSEQVMEFVAASNEIVLVTTPEPTSITDSYSLLKALYKRPDFDPSKVCIRVISNRAASKEDGSIVFNKINSVVMQFLNGSLEYLGYVPSDAMVEKAVRQQKILSIYDPTSKAARSFEEIAKRLLDNESAALDEKRTISHVFSNFFNRKQ